MDDGLEDGAHPVLTALGAVRSAVHALSDAESWSLSEGELLAGMRTLREAENALAAQRLRLVREIDARGAATAQGATSTAGWLRHALRMRPGAANAQVRLATALDAGVTVTGQAVAGEFAATAAALADGSICEDAADVVVRAVQALPAAVPATTRAEGEAFLLEQAEGHDPQLLGRLGRHLLHVLDPDGADRLASAEQAAVAHRELVIVPDRQPGMHTLRGRVDDETAAALHTALSPLAAPRPTDEGVPDLRSPARRYGDAFAELLTGVLDGGGLPTDGGERRHRRPGDPATSGRGSCPPGRSRRGAGVRRRALGGGCPSDRLRRPGGPGGARPGRRAARRRPVLLHGARRAAPGSGRP